MILFPLVLEKHCEICQADSFLYRKNDLLGCQLSYVFWLPTIFFSKLRSHGLKLSVRIRFTVTRRETAQNSTKTHISDWENHAPIWLLLITHTLVCFTSFYVSIYGWNPFSHCQKKNMWGGNQGHWDPTYGEHELLYKTVPFQPVNVEIFHFISEYFDLFTY